MESTERRSSPRKPIRLAAQLDLGRGENWPCQIADFCAEGLFIRYSQAVSHKLDAALGNAGGQSLLVRFRGSDSSGVPGQRHQLQVEMRHRVENAMGVCFVQVNAAAVSSMLKQCSGARVASSAHLRAPSERVQFVLHQCAKAVVQFIDPLMQDCLDQTVAALQAHAREAGNNQLANELMDASGQLNSRQRQVWQQMAKSLESPLKPESKAGPAGSLAVVDKGEFEDWLSLRVMITKADTLYRGSLLQLKLRLDSLKVANATGYTNPLGPSLVCESFRDGLAPLRMSREVEKVAFGVFEYSVLQQLEPLYVELNNILIRQDVLPNLDLTKYLADTQRSESASEASKPAEQIERQAVPIAGPTTEPAVESETKPQAAARFRPVLEPGSDQESAQFQEHARLARHAFSTVRSLLNTLASSRAAKSQVRDDEFPANAPPLSNAQLQQQLQQLQTVALPTNDSAASLWERVVSKVRVDSQGKLDTEQQGAVDVVDRFFESLHESPKLDEPTRRHLRQLEIPVLKVVMRDPDFFEDEQSPVRGVLNRLAQLGSRGSRVNPVIQRRVEELIQSIVTGFEHDLGVFERAEEELEELIERQKRVYQRNVERVKAAAEGAQKVAESKQAVEDTLQARLAGKIVPKALNSLLAGGWRDLLSLTWIRHGPNSELWQDYLGVVDSLVLFTKDPHSEINLPELLRTIQDGLSSISSSHLPSAQIRDELRRFLVRDPKSAPEVLAIPESPAAPSRLRTLPEQGQRWRKRVQALHTGDWLCDQHPSNEPVYIRLVWIARDFQRLVFVNHQGMRVVELELDTLADKMRQGYIVPDPHYQRPLVDEGLDRMVRKVYDQLASAASHDELTGLLERREFERQLDQQLTCWQTPRTLLRLSLRNFSKFNDGAGEQAGNDLLQQVAAILSACCAEDTPIARLSGAQFALLLPAVDAMTLTRQLSQQVSALQPMLRDKPFGLKLGAALVPQLETLLNPLLWLEAAEQTLHANASQREAVGEYRPAPADEAQQQKIVAKVAGLQDKQQERLSLRCQKIMPLHPETRRLIQYDVLTGVYDDDGNLVGGKDFIRLAERYDQIQALNRWVVGTMLDWLKLKADDLQQFGGIVINLSGHSLNDPALLEFIYEKLNEPEAPVERLCFEITEASAVRDMVALTGFVREMKELGCCFCLGNMGNGPDSFQALRSLPVDMLKIDSALTANLVNSQSDQTMLRSMVEMAHYLEREVIVTQVESRELLALLVQLGVDYAQGTAIGKPGMLDSLV
jgi:diguanylate cyclase (GGDEF)-like protein